MKKCYFEVPIERVAKLGWPSICPLTGMKGPTAKMRMKQAIHQPTPAAVVAGPLLGSKRRQIAIDIPIAQSRASLLAILGALSWILVLGAIAVPILILSWIDPCFKHARIIMPIDVLLLLVGLMGFIIRKVLRSGAKVTYVSSEIVDLAFKSEGYAEEFSRLNSLPYEKRLFKVRVY